MPLCHQPGSGGAFATAAARALIDVEGMDSATIAAKSMKIASDMCVYTNNNFISEVGVGTRDGGPQR